MTMRGFSPQNEAWAQLGPDHPLAFRAAAKVLKNAPPGVTVSVPLLFPLCRVSRQHITGAGDEKEEEEGGKNAQLMWWT